MQSRMSMRRWVTTARAFQLLCIGLVAVALGACTAELTHLTRTRELVPSVSGTSDSQAILIDAKQRAILSRRLSDDQVQIGASWVAFCAEPSPDALSALAASGGIDVMASDRLKLASAIALSEGAASIGLRTQSIQLMRDAMYRLCEGFADGALDQLSFETLHRRFQSSMVAILAIEQLTGTVRPPHVALTGGAGSGDADLAADLTQKTVDAQAALRAAEADAESRKTESDLATKVLTAKQVEKKAIDDKAAGKVTLSDEESVRKAALTTEIPAAEKDAADKASALAAAQKTTADRKALYEKLDSARQVAIAGGSQAAVKVQLESGTGEGEKSAAAVAGAVTEIVRDTLELGFAREYCASILLDVARTSLNQALILGSVAETCRQYVQADVDGYQEITKARADYVAAQTAGLIAIANRIRSLPAAASADQIAALGRLYLSVDDPSPKGPDIKKVPPAPPPPVPMQ